MSGFFTPGLAAGVPGTTLLPTAQIPVDTELGQGVAPQSVYATPQQIAAMANGAGNVAATAITYASTVVFDASTSSAFSMTFGAGNATITLSNLLAGQEIEGLLTQDGSGNRTLTVANGSGGTTKVSGTPLSTAGGSIDLIKIKNVGTTAAPLYYVWPVAKAFT